MKIRELLTDETKWTKYIIALNKNKNGVHFESNEAVRWCLVGAVRKCYPVIYLEIILKIKNEINIPVPVWNDAPERTFEEIRQLVEKLDI